ncbi:MAG: transcription antitermination factor NusB [Oscillospiraceae bacterium]|nr:transcription antitermination factor NusB [Oscillospiraceae bacterium]
MTRKQAREAAFHALFALTFSPEANQKEIIDLLSPIAQAAWRDECDIYNNPAHEEAEYIEAAVLGVTASAAALDASIEQHAKGWAMGRISRVARTLMRMAIFEPTAIDGVTQATAINEAVKLCKRYDSEEAAAFINGVLGSIARSDEGEKA